MLRHCLALLRTKPACLLLLVGWPIMGFGQRFQRYTSSADRVTIALADGQLVLRPLAENAVKHGIARMLGPGRVRVRAACAGPVLRMYVENDVDPDDAPDAVRRGGGIGLDNVRQRLHAAYGHEAYVRWGRADGASVFRVELALPVETMEE